MADILKGQARIAELRRQGNVITTPAKDARPDEIADFLYMAEH